MSPDRIAFTPYPNDLDLIEQAAKKCGYSVAFLVREVVGNWCADQRRDKRLAMSPAHYTARGVDDGWEAE